jgi:hypothetical protein
MLLPNHAQEHALDPDHDVQSVVMTPGGYGHLRRLADGSLDRALRTIHDEPDLAVRYVNALIPASASRRPADPTNVM